MSGGNECCIQGLYTGPPCLFPSVSEGLGLEEEGISRRKEPGHLNDRMERAYCPCCPRNRLGVEPPKVGVGREGIEPPLTTKVGLKQTNQSHMWSQYRLYSPNAPISSFLMEKEKNELPIVEIHLKQFCFTASQPSPSWCPKLDVSGTIPNKPFCSRKR